jgi:hypothetical protein
MPYTCADCEKTFSRHWNYRRHRRLRHKEEIKTSTPIPRQLVKQSDAMSSAAFKELDKRVERWTEAIATVKELLQTIEGTAVDD